MNAKKILALALAALMLLSLAACGQSAEPAATEAPAEPTEAPVEATEAPAEDTSVTVTDMTGREITLEEPATRIVALTASDCEIICALGGIGRQTVSAASRLKYARINLLSGIANAVASIPSEQTNTASSKNISIVCA